MGGTPWLHSRTKRGFDVAVATVGLVLVSPLLVVTALLVRLRLGSPVAFRQQRAGRHGVPFEVVKFRSMTDARGADGELLPDADRLPGFGRMLRSTSLDELPQLWCVLVGDMSMIGPRPLPMKYVPRYSPEQRRRLDATPGITGWAQVQGRNAVAWPDKLANDVWYVDHAGWRLDAKILALTVRAVFGGSGVTADGHATMPEFMGSDTPSPDVTGET